MFKQLRVPHTLVLLAAIIVLALVSTWILPSGAYQREGRAVIPGSFELLEEKTRLSPLTLLTIVPRAMADAHEIIFFVFLVGGVIAILRHTGAIDAAIGAVLQYFGHRVNTLIFAGMLMFGVFSASFGMATEYIAFVGVLVSMGSALKFDRIAAVGLMVVGYGIGYGCSLLNPFTVIIAQDIAGVPKGSGMWFRGVTAIPFFLVGYHHVLSYFKKVQRDPAMSLMHGVEVDDQRSDRGDYPQMNWRHALVLTGIIAAIAILIYGVGWKDWYLVELGALFLGLGLFAAIVGGVSPDQAAKSFVSGASELTGTALLIGFARAIALTMEEGKILDTVVHGLATPLGYLPAELSAIGMLLIQNLMNFFIPSGSGQAYATMPIMAPLGDIVGVNRQATVLAYQYGDGFANMIVPTNAVLMGILGLAGIPYDRWLRFIFPLMVKLFIASSIMLIIAVRIGLQ
ncbi:MAG TPA: TIGR00366 family protein [Pirellulaceae bacterium]|nr:TIGR00366 family protein [Pirellulaceae bacterium]HMO91687.1 TIGR00366 family protein [Pirellulaceae bacterium]HMP68384.1 TIGR00366 family protein [Pirellulaceae bacterium]